MIGILSWILHTAVTFAVAFLFIRMLGSGRKSLDLALLVFFWVFFTTLSLLLLGIAGILTPNAIGGFSLGGCVILASLQKSRVILAGVPDWFRMIWRTFVNWWAGLQRWLQVLTIIFVTYMMIRTVFLIWALPPFVWDSLAYHLTNVAQWIQDARIHTFDTPVERIYNAANHEVFTVWFAIFIGRDVIIEAAGLPAYFISGFAVFAIARNLELKQSSSWLAVLAYLSTPALTLAITGTKNDPIMAALYLLAIAVTLEITNRPDTESNLRSWNLLVALAAILLYAAGTKAYIAHLFIGIFFVALAMLIRKHGWRGAWAIPKDFLREIRGESVGVKIVVGFFIGAALFLGSYWYIRNWVLMGNPFFPYSVQVGNNEIVTSDIGGFKFGLHNFYETLRLFVERFGDKQYRIRPDLPFTTGWGWVAYGMGIPAAAWSFIRKRSFRVLAVGFLISFVGLLFSSPTSPWNMRYFIWFPACLAIAIGFVFDHFFQYKIKDGAILIFLFSGLSALNLIMVVTYNSVRIQDIQSMLNLPIEERGAAMFSMAVPDAYQEFVRYVPRDELLGYNVTGNGFVYPLYRADFSQRIVFIPIRANDDCEDIFQAMKSRGTRYLQTAPVQTSDLVRSKLFQCSQGNSRLRERGVDLYVLTE